VKVLQHNPELLVLENPGPRDKARVWRLLRNMYPLEKAAVEYNKVYPKSIRRVKRNKGGGPDTSSRKYKAAIKLFRKFHGREPDPDEIFEIDVPQLKGIKEDMYLVVLGEAPAEPYDASEIIEGSSKGGSVYVHPYESPEGKRPLKVVTHDGKLIMTLPGKHKVSDWIRG